MAFYERIGLRVLRGRLGPYILRWFPRPTDRIAQRMVRGSSEVPVLLLTTTGLRTGETHAVPLLFLSFRGSYVVLASNYGRPVHPDWSSNLMANPDATVQVNGSSEPVLARNTTGQEWERLWSRLLELWPGWGNYQRRTSRRFRIFVLVPEKILPAKRVP